MVFLPKAAILTLAIVSVSHGAVVTEGWSIGSTNIAPDGFTRSAALVDGVFPGPLLKANKGDTIVVNVVNNLTDSTMRRSTSIVCRPKLFSLPNLLTMSM